MASLQLTTEVKPLSYPTAPNVMTTTPDARVIALANQPVPTIIPTNYPVTGEIRLHTAVTTLQDAALTALTATEVCVKTSLGKISLYRACFAFKCR